MQYESGTGRQANSAELLRNLHSLKTEIERVLNRSNYLRDHTDSEPAKKFGEAAMRFQEEINQVLTDLNAEKDIPFPDVAGPTTPESNKTHEK